MRGSTVEDNAPSRCPCRIAAATSEGSSLSRTGVISGASIESDFDELDMGAVEFVRIDLQVGTAHGLAVVHPPIPCLARVKVGGLGIEAVDGDPDVVRSRSPGGQIAARLAVPAGGFDQVQRRAMPDRERDACPPVALALEQLDRSARDNVKIRV